MMRPSDQNLVIRTDAGTRIGTGHLMRCLALAQAWQDSGGRVIFIMATEVPALEARLKSEGMEIVHLSAPPGTADDAIQSADLARQSGAPWFVLDGYQFGPDYQRLIKEVGMHLLFIDDNGHADHYYADWVLNQNLHADVGLYPNREAYTRFLLGTRYALLRREFLRRETQKREVPEVARKVLVTLGGSDPDNVTLRVIQALQQVRADGLEAAIVVGAGNPHYAELQSAAGETGPHVRLEWNVANMPALLAWADIALAAAGTTSWELAFAGLPNLLLVLADNQRLIAERLDRSGAALNMGWHENLSPADIARVVTRLLGAAGLRAEMAHRGRELVDGEGVGRVLMPLRGKMLRLRRLREGDCKLLWEWANDPEVRAAAFSSNPVPWKEHVQWFVRKLHDTNCYLSIALDDQDTPVGQVRFDVIKEDEAEIDVSIDRNKRGLRYGGMLISTAVEELFRATPVRAVHAFIKPENKGSIRAFENARFKRLEMQTVKGNTAMHYLCLNGDGQ